MQVILGVSLRARWDTTLVYIIERVLHVEELTMCVCLLLSGGHQ